MRQVAASPALFLCSQTGSARTVKQTDLMFLPGKRGSPPRQGLPSLEWHATCICLSALGRLNNQPSLTACVEHTADASPS